MAVLGRPLYRFVLWAALLVGVAAASGAAGLRWWLIAAVEAAAWILLTLAERTLWRRGAAPAPAGPPAAPEPEALPAATPPRAQPEAAPATGRRRTKAPAAPALAGSSGVVAFGRRTACGQVIGRRTQGVVHPVLPCGVKVYIDYAGRHVLTQVIDHGPLAAGRAFEVTEALARRLGLTGVRKIH